jgi:Fic family protein
MDMIRPYFNVSNEMMNLVAEISEQIGVLSDIADAKTIAYRPPYDVMSEVDFLRAHGELSEGQAGRVGEYSADDRMVPHLMAVLFSWVVKTEVHPLISSCVFHYELHQIRPFSGGNGRLGVLWQVLLMARWRPLLASMPLEQAFQACLPDFGESVENSKIDHFIEMMLRCVRDVLARKVEDKVKNKVKNKNTKKVEDKSSSAVENNALSRSEKRIVDLLSEDARLTIGALAQRAKLSEAGVNKVLASLRRKGVIERIGANKNGFWQVNI